MKNFVLQTMLAFKDDPKFNEDLFTSTIKDYLQPIANGGFVVVPIVTLVACVITGIFWFFKDAEEKAQKPIFKELLPIIISGVVILFLNTILKVVGMAVE